MYVKVLSIGLRILYCTLFYKLSQRVYLLYIVLMEKQQGLGFSVSQICFRSRATAVEL